MDLNGQEGEVRFTLEITRANGSVDVVEMVGKIGKIEDNKTQQLENLNECDAQHSS